MNIYFFSYTSWTWKLCNFLYYIRFFNELNLLTWGSFSVFIGISYTAKRDRLKKQRGKSLKSGKNWILEKKERRRRQGKEVRADSKYTGRKRSGKFWNYDELRVYLHKKLLKKY